MSLNLLDINDDCLWEIFTNFTVFELADIAPTCTKFKSIARNVFPSRNKSNCFHSDFFEGDEGHRSQVAAVLENFGDLLSNVKVTFFRNEQQMYNTLVFNMMTTYCTGTLDRLELKYCNFLETADIVDGSALFRNVKDLTLDDSLGIQGSYLADAVELTRFNLNASTAIESEAFLSNDYPKLQSLILSNIRRSRGQDSIDIASFLKRHPKVTELKLRGGGVAHNLSSIGECSGLRKVTIWNCDSDVSPIAQLDRLTALKLSINFGESIVDVLNASMSFRSLEELEFTGRKEDVSAVGRFVNLRHLSMILTLADIDDDFLSDFPRLRELRTLSIGGKNLHSTSDGVLSLVERLPHLEQLCIHPHPVLFCNRNRIDVSESTYSEICEIYQKRKQKLVIYNFDISNEQERRLNRKKPFAGDDRQKFVQFIALDRDGIFRRI